MSSRGQDLTPELWYLPVLCSPLWLHRVLVVPWTQEATLQQRRGALACNCRTHPPITFPPPEAKGRTGQSWDLYPGSQGSRWIIPQVVSRPVLGFANQGSCQRESFGFSRCLCLFLHHKPGGAQRQTPKGLKRRTDLSSVEEFPSSCLNQ